MSILKVDKTLVPSFFLIFYSLVSKIEICLKYILDKNTQKQSLWTASAAFFSEKSK